MRQTPTEAEKLLWNYLRKKQLEGVKFRRQQPIDRYIVDFVSFEKRLIIEVDGGQHAEMQQAYDGKRDEYLKAQGFVIMRFWNNEVLENMEGVWDSIALALAKIPPHPNPPPQGGRGFMGNIDSHAESQILTSEC